MILFWEISSLSLTPFKNEELLLVFISLAGSKMRETSARTG